MAKLFLKWLYSFIFPSAMRVSVEVVSICFLKLSMNMFEN